MLNHLHFKNFKGWADTGPIRLAPITVFFGGNSSGKTSLNQLILLLKQTAQSSDRQRVLHPGDANTLVDLGTYEDIIFSHSVEQSIWFELGWTTDGRVRVVDPLQPDVAVESDALRFAATIGADRRHQPFVEHLSYRMMDGTKSLLQVGMERRPKDGKYDLTADGYKPVRQSSGRRWELPQPVRFYGFPDEAVAYYQNTGFVADLTLKFENLLSSVFYVGPLREYPRRLYLWAGEPPDHVGQRGQKAIEALLSARGRRYNRKWRAPTHTLDEVVAIWLKRMKLIDEFRVVSLAEHRKEYEVLVRTTPGSAEVKLTDVGFGVSQLLPVLIECFYVPSHSLIIFEQPEIHLHPRVQADLADLFIEAIRMREGAAERSVQIIVESHSEHFLRRLQLRIAEGKANGGLDADEAALYFCSAQEGGSRLSQLDVDMYGNIRNWPDNFFGDEMGDLVARAEAQARRASAGERADK